MATKIVDLCEGNMKTSFESGYVVLPVEVYRELVLRDISSVGTIKLSDSKWSYGEVSVDIPKKYFSNIFSGAVKEMYPAIILDENYNQSVTIGTIPKDIMDAMLGKDQESAEDE